MPLRSRLSIAKTTVLATAMTTAAAAAVILGPVGDASASTGNACNSNYNSTDYPVLTCINIVGTGLHVNSDTGWFRNISGSTEKNVHLELTGNAA